MPLRYAFLGFVLLTWSWGLGVDRANGQGAAKSANAEKLVRLTYPVGDLIVPIQDHTAFSERNPAKQPREITKDGLAESLRNFITRAVAKESWQSAGGEGRIQYFPMGLALVIEQRAEVHAEIQKLLVKLRHEREVQASVTTHLVTVAPKMASRLLHDLKKHGQPVRAFADEHGKQEKPANGVVSVDEKRLALLLEAVQADRASNIMQPPKITVYDRQRAFVCSTADNRFGIVDGIRADFRPIADAERQTVRLFIELECAFKLTEADGVLRRDIINAAGAFAVPSGQTIVWHLGETKERQHLFVLATPRIVIVKDDEPLVFLGQLAPKGVVGGEEQSAPAPKAADQPPSARERAIAQRLRQPISLNMNKVPLKQAIKDIAIASGLQIVPDELSLTEARINMDHPLSIAVKDIEMRSALNILLRPLRLRYVIENDVLKITTEKRDSRRVQKIYRVADLVKTIPTVEGQPSREVSLEKDLIKVIVALVAKDSWAESGGPGTIEFDAAAKSLKICHTQEVHEEVEALLVTLRRVQNSIVNVDLRFVHASSDMAKKWRAAIASQDRSSQNRRGADGGAPHTGLDEMDKYLEEDRNWQNLDGTDSCKGPRPFAALDEKQVQGLLEVAQADRRLITVQAPRLNIYDGQRIPFECVQKEIAKMEFRAASYAPDVVEAAGDGAKEAAEDKGIVLTRAEKTVSGWRATAQPTVSPDRRFVRLALSFEHFTKDEANLVERSVKAARTVHLPDGRTLVWDLGENASRQHLFVLIRPRVMVRETPEPAVIEEPLVPEGRLGERLERPYQ